MWSYDGVEFGKYCVVRCRGLISSSKSLRWMTHVKIFVCDDVIVACVCMSSIELYFICK